jgi:hypothetical protein
MSCLSLARAVATISNYAFSLRRPGEYTVSTQPESSPFVLEDVQLFVSNYRFDVDSANVYLFLQSSDSGERRMLWSRAKQCDVTVPV